MSKLSPYLLQRAVPAPKEELGSVPESRTGDEGVHLYDYWRVVRKRRWGIVAFFLIVELVTAAVVFLMPPAYTAETTLLIEQQIPKIVDIQQDSLSEDPGQEQYSYYKTQYGILKSRSLAAQVIQEQGLRKSALFTGAEGHGSGGSLWATERQKLRSLFSNRSAHSPQTDSALINSYLENTLVIEPVKDTQLVKIAVSTPDPELSARVANAHADAYIRLGLTLRARPTEEAEGFLRKKLGELKERVGVSEAMLNRYRREKGLISLDDKENIVVERLSDLNRRLTEAEATRIALEAQVLLIRKREYDSLPAVVNHGLIQTLKTQLSRLEGEYAQLAVEFKPTYSRLDQLLAQLRRTRSRLQRETQGVVAGIESAYLAARENEQTLRTKMEEQKTAILALKDAAVEYAVLGRELDTNRQLYEGVLQKMKEMGVAAEVRTSNVVVIDKAAPPLTPSRPNKSSALALSTVIGLLGGVAFAFFREYVDNTLNTPEAVERSMHLPTLTVVPDFLSINGRSDALRLLPRSRSHPVKALTPTTNLVFDYHPLSVVAEAYRMLRTAILLSRAEEPPKTILFTSATDQEGKTLTVMNTAIVFAQMNVRVLVIDADLRRSGCHSVLGNSRRKMPEIRNTFGLTELLTGQRRLDEVILPVANNLFSLLSSGAAPPNPAELLGSRKMQDTLATLREVYDYILIDAPPVIPVTDGVVLSALVDGVVLVVNGQATPYYLAQQACARLNYARAKVIGAVLNRVDPRSWDYTYSYNHPSSYVLN